MSGSAPSIRRRATWAVVLLALAGCQLGGASDDGRQRLIAVDDRKLAPVLRGLDLDGNPIDTSALRDAPLVLNVWGSWCAPCKAEQGELLKVASESPTVRFVGVDIRDTKANARAHVRKYLVGYPSLFDGDSRLVARLTMLPANAVPSTLVLDRQGRVAVVIIGPTTYAELAPLVRTIAAEPAA